MAEKYIVYQYVKNKIHDCDYKKLLQRQNLSQSNKVFFNNGEMLKKWIYHLIVTLGKTRVFTLCNNNTLVHYTFFTPYCYKFGFMDRHDYVIGPCWTAEAFRGNHIYPITICNVAYQLTQKNINSHVYLLVRPIIRNLLMLFYIHRDGFRLGLSPRLSSKIIEHVKG